MVARFTTQVKKNLETSFVARHVRAAVVKRWLPVFCCLFYCSISYLKTLRVVLTGV